MRYNACQTQRDVLDTERDASELNWLGWLCDHPLGLARPTAGRQPLRLRRHTWGRLQPVTAGVTGQAPGRRAPYAPREDEIPACGLSRVAAPLTGRQAALHRGTARLRSAAQCGPAGSARPAAPAGYRRSRVTGRLSRGAWPYQAQQRMLRRVSGTGARASPGTEGNRNAR
jgi:hypothetical protein